ncbi:ABC transporter permease [Facklamia hominis]
MEEKVFSNDDFQLVGITESETDVVSDKVVSFWQEVFLTFKKNKLAMFGLVVLVLVALMAIFVPIFSPYTYSEQTSQYNAAPSSQFWFGTDNLGRDIFVRAWVGARISLFIGLSAALVNVLIGVVYGSIAGLAGGKVDNLMMRICDVLNAVPYLLIVIMLLVVMKQGLVPMIAAMTITGWISMARIVRTEVLSLKNQEYVLAARTLGASTGHLIFRHLVPNAMGIIIVQMTLSVPGAIFTESYLSFLGLGVTPPMSSWGTMASEGAKAILTAPWRLLFPALLISLTIFAFNAVGDGLRDALDPKLRK